MFLVSDPPSVRARFIRDLLQQNPSVAVVVAATYFEWSLSRAVIALSSRPNVTVRKALEKVYGLDYYKDLWRDEISEPGRAVRLPKVFHDWHAITKAFDARNVLVHGRDRYTLKMATPHVELLLSAVTEIHEYALKRGVDLGKKLKVRMVRKTPTIAKGPRTSIPVSQIPE